MACAHAKYTGELGVCVSTSGPGRDPSAQRALRRQARPPARARDRRPAVPRRARAAATCRRSTCSRALQGRRPRVRPDGDRARAGPPPARPRRAHRAGRAHADLPDPARPTSRSWTRSPEPPHEHYMAHSVASGFSPAARRPGRRRPAARGRDPERRASGSRSWSAGRARAPPTRSRRWPSVLGAGVAKALLGKPVLPDDLPCVTGLHRPARHQAELGPDDGLRHAADGRVRLPVRRVPARGGPGARRADRHRRAPARAALPDGGEPRSATAPSTLRALLPLLERKEDRSWRDGGRARRRATGGRSLEARARWRTPTRSTPSACSGSSRPGCPRTACWPSTRARRPTGTPAT